MARSGLAEPARGLLDVRGGTPVICAARSRRPLADGGLHGFQARGVLCDEVAVVQPVAQEHVEHRQEQGKIGARAHREIQIGVARDRRHARIDDDELAAIFAALPEVLGRDRRAFGDVRSRDQHDLRLRAGPATGLVARSMPNVSL